MSHFVIARIQIERLTLTPNQRFSLRRLALSESNCAEVDAVIGRPQGWRVPRHRLRRLTALDPARSPVYWLCMRSVEDRARGALVRPPRSGWDPISAVVRSSC